MGQHQSMAAKGNAIPGFFPPTTDSNHDNANRFSVSQNAGQDQGSSSSGGVTTNPASLSANLAADHTQSVRAAIDSFIETCLAGGSDDSSPSSAKPKAESESASKVVEVITVPDEDGSDDTNSGSGVQGSACASVEGSGKKTVKGQECEDSLSSKPLACAPDKQPDSVVSAKSDVGGKQAGKSDNCEGPLGHHAVQSKDKASDSPRTMSITPLSAQANSDSGLASHSMISNSGSDATRSRDANDSSSNSSEGDGMPSMRLKTIIDRVLDSSLGGGLEVKSIPSEQRILSQITADEQGSVQSLQNSDTKTSKGGEPEGSKVPEEGMADRRMEPVAICFMEHIEKAVERSFSSITEEEERKEKEKALVSQTPKDTENKQQNWGSWTSKHNETPISSAPSVSEGAAISVQDIVDRVISQTEVISKLMTSTGASSYTDSKPLVSASGTFYPDRAPPESSSQQSQQRHDPHRDDMPRESAGRRGRPKMRTGNYYDREPSGPPARDSHMPHRAMGGGGPPEDYIQSMQVSLAKYGQVTPHRMPPYLPSSSVGQGASVHNAMVAAAMGGMHSVASSMHQPQHPHHGLASQHASSSAQPPPLLRMDRSERAPPHPQQKHHHPHPPSKACGCSACVAYFSCERDGERVRMMPHQGPGEKSMPRMSPHSPHHPYSKPSSAAHHPLKWPGAEARHPELKQEKAHPHYPYSSYPPHAARGPDPYPASHPAYGIQTGVPVPHMSYPDNKPVPEVRHPEPAYPKTQDRGDYLHRRTQPGYEEAPMAGRHSYPSHMASVKPIGGPHHPAYPQPHPSTRVHSAPKVEEQPLAESPYRRDRPVAPPAEVAEDEKPLDLSAKKPSPSAPYHEQPDLRHQHRENYRRYDGGQPHADHHGHGGPYMERPREGDRGLPASQHLHNLETSVETYFQKFHPHATHRGIPAHNMSAGPPPQSISVGRPHQSVSNRSAVPLPPHHPTHPPQHHSPAGRQSYTPTSQPSPSYPTEPLLSPGGRRPQLHPIPAPNPSTSLGSTGARIAPGFQSRAGAPSMAMAGEVPSLAMVSPAPGAGSPAVVSMPSAVPCTTGPLPSPQRSGSSGGNAFASDMRAVGSRSVSPPGGDDGRAEERRRGSVSKHEPIQNIIGNNNPQDILYLICRLCRQTYGSPYGFRKHFRNQHGFEPKAEHTLVQTISATKNARQMSGGMAPSLDPESEQYPVAGKVMSGDGVTFTSHSSSPQPELIRSVPAESSATRGGEAMADIKGDNVDVGGADFKRSGSFSRSTTDSKGRSPSGSASGSSVGDEREDTKFLECPECGQTFQLNDFGSYKRHCRQHGQMRGVQGGSGGGQGTYTCTECQCSFPEAHLLQEHLVRHQAHAGSASFRSAAECQDHARTVHGNLDPPFSVSPAGVSCKPGVTSAPSTPDISSTSSGKNELVSASSADSSMSFNLKVTTPSDLEIRRLPADPIVTSASPDSSSDNKKGQENSLDGRKVQDGSPVSSSEQNKMELLKTEPSSRDSPRSVSSEVPDLPRLSDNSQDKGKSSEGSKSSIFSDTDRSSMAKPNSLSTEGSSASTFNTEEPDLFMYKHKKFSAHRKRSASSETSASDAKQLCVRVDKPNMEKMQQNIVSSASDKQAKNPDKEMAKEDSASTPLKAGSSKTEARHQMPFVWDRVTRSQAGKNTRSSDYS